MTLREFFTQFEEVVKPDRWHVRSDTAIRNIRSGHCPLSFTAAKRKRGIPPCEITPSAEVLGLTPSVAQSIADAADGCSDGPIRKKLLAIVKG